MTTIVSLEEIARRLDAGVDPKQCAEDLRVAAERLRQLNLEMRAILAARRTCDGQHPIPACVDPQCWCNEPVTPPEKPLRSTIEDLIQISEQANRQIEAQGYIRRAPLGPPPPPLPDCMYCGARWNGPTLIHAAHCRASGGFSDAGYPRIRYPANEAGNPIDTRKRCGEGQPHEVCEYPLAPTGQIICVHCGWDFERGAFPPLRQQPLKF